MDHVREEMTIVKGHFRRGGMALVGKEGGQVKIRSGQLFTAQSSASPLAAEICGVALKAGG